MSVNLTQVDPAEPMQLHIVNSYNVMLMKGWTKVGEEVEFKPIKLRV